MGKIVSLKIAFAVLFLCFCSSMIHAEERKIFNIGGGVSLSGTDAQPVSHGHAYLVVGEPSCVFGGVQERGVWRLNYLVLIKHQATSTSTFRRGNPDPATSSSTSDGKIRKLNFNERIQFDKSTLEFSYQANFNAVSDKRISEKMTFQGNEIDLSQGRVFVADMTTEPVTYKQVNANLPSSEKIDFLNSTAKQYQTFTNQWISELSKNSKFVAKTFKP